MFKKLPSFTASEKARLALGSRELSRLVGFTRGAVRDRAAPGLGLADVGHIITGLSYYVTSTY